MDTCKYKYIVTIQLKLYSKLVIKEIFTNFSNKELKQKQYL